MKTYNIDGQRYNVPDDWTPEMVWDAVKGAPKQQETSQPFSTPVQPGATNVAAQMPQTTDKIDPSTLKNNQDWLNASRTIYKKVYGVNPDPMKVTDEDLAEFGLDQMGWFNYNLPRMAVDAAKLKTSSEDEKKAFLYLMDTYDNLQVSWGGFGRFIKGAALDPFTYVGLSTLGVGLAGRSASQALSKEGFKSMLRAGVYTGIEGGILVAGQEAIQQTARINAGGQEGYDAGKIATAGAIGVGAGVLLGGAADGVATAIRGRGMQAAGGAINPNAATPSGTPNPPAGASQAAPNAQGATPTPPTAGAAPTPTTASPMPANTSGMIPNTWEPLPTRVEPLPAGPSPKATDILRAIDNVSSNTGGRMFLNEKEAIAMTSKQARDMLLNVTSKDIGVAVDDLSRASTRPEERQVLTAMLDKATNVLESRAKIAYNDMVTEADPVLKAQKMQDLAQLEKIRDTVKEADTNLSSQWGLEGVSRKDSFNTGSWGRELREEDFLVERNLDPVNATPEQKAWAKERYYQEVQKWQDLVTTKDEIKAFDKKIAEAYASGDNALAAQLAVQKWARIDSLTAEELQKLGLKQGDGTVTHSTINKINEYIISTVFSTSTIIINTVPSLVKTLYRPMLDFIVRGGPIETGNFKQMVHTYSAMTSSMGTAAKAARLAFDYEKALLTSADNKLLENNAQIRGPLGRALRIFPRILNATDEFFSQMNYRGFVAGEAASQAAIRAAGKPRDVVNREVNKAVKEALAKAFAPDIDAPNVLDDLRRIGMTRGLEGPKLEAWLKHQLDNNADLLRQAQNLSGKRFSDDLLFKREFSGQDAASNMAKGYENFVNKHPWMRLAGQLFFRTPVRVFEEGFRLTPGLNVVSGMVAGQFLKDLRGLNGKAPQARAMGEAMLSIGIGTWAMMMYAQGRLTGGGPSNWRQRRNMEETDNWKPYNIIDEDGKTGLDFRNLDPFSTPLKIIANALDKYNELTYREAQGERMDKNMLEQYVIAPLTIASFSVVRTIKDANLTEGVSQIIDAIQMTTDPENKENQMIRLLSQKSKLLVPNQWQKIQAQKDPTMYDPFTPDQAIAGALGPDGRAGLEYLGIGGSDRPPKQYDVLGVPRTIGNPAGMLTGIRIGSIAEAGRSGRDQKVINWLSGIEIATNSYFVIPYTHAVFPGGDLRSMKTKDGVSYYDKLYQNYQALDPGAKFYTLMRAAQRAPIGTASTDGPATEAAKDLFNTLKEAAFIKLMKEEFAVTEAFAKQKLKEAQIMSGKFEATSQPYRR